MTFDEIKASTKTMLTPADISEVLGSDKHTISIQVAEDIAQGKNSLGFHVCKVGNRVKIPRQAFIAFIEGTRNG